MVKLQISQETILHWDQQSHHSSFFKALVGQLVLNKPQYKPMTGCRLSVGSKKSHEKPVFMR